ncbi:hypothetical protein EZY14_003115 [Kordia sp. TARA_039_SRF]|jgi:hypothetical protein|nr:hypothetical protein EZY14_003115 [Kordia sp. TARA_039_SRF]
MKKTKFNKLKLNKESISKLDQAKIGGAVPAETCEGPCQGGTGCCNPGEPIEKCYTEHDGGASCGWICILTDPNYSLLCSRVF